MSGLPTAARSLTVVQLASCFTGWGGMEMHLLNLGEQLRQRGHQVIIAAQPDRFVVRQAEDRGLETFAATVRRQQDYADFWRYVALFRSRRVDVVHAHSSCDMVMGAVAARLARVPVRVLTWHLPKPFKTPRSGRTVASLFSRLIAVSDSVRRMHLAAGIPPDKVVTIHHGTDVEAFARTTCSPAVVREAWGLRPEHLVVAVAGRVSHEKGHAVLLEALSRLAPTHPDVRVVVIGEGPDEAAMRALSEELGVADRVVFAGFRSDVNNALLASDIVAVPSTWDEPCSAVVQQGMALGRPVVGTRAGGTPEMVVDGETGLLVPVGDADALAEAVASLAGDAFLRRRMGEAGRSRVERLFSLSVMTDKIEELYHREYSKVRGRQGLRECSSH